MIVYLERKQLDIKKYDTCITNSLQSKVYAFSWYLDCVAENWGALILDDYVAVMPLPKKKRYGIEFLYQPEWVQQLGLFSENEISQKAMSSFIKENPFVFLFYYNFNTQNLNLKHRRKSIKINYELNLNEKYDTINKKYRKDRKKSLRKATESGLYFDNKNDAKGLIQLYQEVFQLLNFKDKSFNILQELIKFCIIKKYGFQRNIYMSNQIVARGFFILFQNRIYYLFGASNEAGKKNGATTFMIDSVIKQFSETKTIFDFEGSSIPTIGNFYKSFGSKNTPYPVFEPRKGFILIKKLLNCNY